MVKRIVENYMLKDKKSNQWVARSGKSANDIFYYFTEKRDEALKFKSQEEVDAEKEQMKSLGFKTDIFEVVPESADYQKKRFKEPYYMYESADSTLLYKLNIGDRFTTTVDKNKVFEITGRKGDTTYVKEVATGKETYFGTPDAFVIPVSECKKAIKEDAPQKIVIKNAWGVEVKDYKAGDPIPAGAKFKIFNAKDTDKIEAYADSLFESISSKTHKFRPEELKVGKRVIDKVGGKEVRGKITVNHNDLYGSNPYTPEMKGSTVVTVQTDSGRSYDVDANDNGGEFILEAAEVSVMSIPVGGKFKDKIGGKEYTFYVVKHGDDDVVHAKEVNGTMRMVYDTDSNTKVKKVEESVIKAIYRGSEHRLNKEGYVADKDGKMLAPWKTQAYDFGSESDAAKAIKVIEKKPEWKDFTLVVEGRIAKGYENLDADEKARHLLSHPSSKYMSDLKSENITERAIRKAVKEMLGKPDKRDPQFIIDVNEEGEAPAATSTANVATPELPMKLKEATKVPYLLKNAKVGDTFHDGSDLGREYKITRVTPSKVYATCVKDPNTTGEYNRNHPDYAETDPQWAKLYTIKESVGQKINISLVRKPYNMKDVDEDIRSGNADRVKAIVDKSYKLSASEYDKFVYNFMVHTTYLSGEGGVDPDGTVHVVEITAPGKKTIYVDPEGYDYARYVGY